MQANVANAAGDLRLDLPAGWKADTAIAAVSRSPPPASSDQLTFEVTPPAGETTADLHAVATVNGRDIESGMQMISYPHFPPQTLFPPSDIKLVRANIKVTAHKIGYIMGAGDEMPDALRQLGLDVTLLSPVRPGAGRSLALRRHRGRRARLQRARRPAREPAAPAWNTCKNGGTLHVQYQTRPSAGLNMGPYPFTVPGGNQYRVTVEDAPVTFPHPDSPLLQTPNHISAEGFRGLGAGARRCTSPRSGTSTMRR